jgi:hypothetical protein
MELGGPRDEDIAKLRHRCRNGSRSETQAYAKVKELTVETGHFVLYEFFLSQFSSNLALHLSEREIRDEIG